MQGVAVELGVHGDGGDAELTRGADDAHGDLAAVGDEDLLQHAANVGSGRCPASTLRWAARGASRPGTRRDGPRAGTSSTSTRPAARTTTSSPRPAQRPDRSVLVADYQHAGRGRRDRSWTAMPGQNLLASILFHDVPSEPMELPRRVSLAAVDACRCFTDGVVALKWPNDVLLDDRKLAGVLAQRTAAGSVVVGVGVNVGWSPDGASRLGPDVEPLQLLAELLAAFDRLPVSAHDVRERYRAELATLGRRVRVELPDGELLGTATDLAFDGRLVVVDDAGDGAPPERRRRRPPARDVSPPRSGAGGSLCPQGSG